MRIGLGLRIAGVALAAAGIAVVAVILLESGEKADAPPPFSGISADFTAFEPARPAPAAALVNGAGESVALDSLRPRLVLLNFWATWCAPCVRELPALDRLQATLGGPEFEVVAASLDRKGRDAVEPFFARHGVRRLAIYLDSTGAASRAFGVSALPATFLIGRDGRVLGRLDGAAEWDSGEALALLRFYVAPAD